MTDYDSILNSPTMFGVSLTPGTGVTDEDILSVREAQQEMMPEVVRIFKRTNAKDPRGGDQPTYTQLVDDSIGRIGKVKDSQQIAFAGQLRGKATATLTVPYGTDLAEHDKVKVNPADNTRVQGDYYIVADLSRSSFSTAARYLIEEV